MRYDDFVPGDLFLELNFNSSTKAYIKNIAFAKELVKGLSLEISGKVIYIDEYSKDSFGRLNAAFLKFKETMFVSPLIWMPERKHLRRFGFAFFPYINKFDYVYDDKVDITELIGDLRYFPKVKKNLSIRSLNELISMRTKLIANGHKPSLISLENSKTLMMKNPIYYSGFIYEDAEFSNMNLNNLKTFVKCVLDEYGLSIFDIDELKTVFVISEDNAVINNVRKAYSLIRRKVNVSKIAGMTMKEHGLRHQFIFFSYDDGEFDSVSQHFNFFSWDPNFFD